MVWRRGKFLWIHWLIMEWKSRECVEGMKWKYSLSRLTRKNQDSLSVLSLPYTLTTHSLLVFRLVVCTSNKKIIMWNRNNIYMRERVI